MRYVPHKCVLRRRDGTKNSHHTTSLFCDDDSPSPIYLPYFDSRASPLFFIHYLQHPETQKVVLRFFPFTSHHRQSASGSPFNKDLPNPSTKQLNDLDIDNKLFSFHNDPIIFVSFRNYCISIAHTFRGLLPVQNGCSWEPSSFCPKHSIGEPKKSLC